MIFKQIKWAYQRVRYGYDDTLMWNLDCSFANFIEPIEKFCEEELSDKNRMCLNPKRKKIFSTTLKLIELNRNDNSPLQESTNKLWEYIGKNIQAFWNENAYLSR